MINVNAVLESGWVERYHSATTVPNQLLGQHQWGVAILILHLCEKPSAELLKVALLHDAPELHTGDLPAPVKNLEADLKDRLDKLEENWWLGNIGDTVQLSAEETKILKLADCLEGAIYCIRQYAAGHKGAAFVCRKWEQIISQRFTFEFLEKYKAFDILQDAWGYYHDKGATNVS